MFRLLHVALVAVVAVTVVGCRHRQRPVATVSGPGINTKRETALMDAAQAKLQCDRASLVGAFEGSLETNYHAYRVDGCGKRYHALLHCTGVCNWREAPEMRAEVDLQCPAAQMTRVYAQGTHVFTISGCGRTVAYELGQGHLRPVQASAVNAPIVAPPVTPPPSSGTPPPPPPPPPPSP